MTFSLDSARRTGWVGGIALFGAATVSDLVFGFDQLGNWRFLASFVVFALVLGQIVRALVGVLVLRDDFRRADREAR